MQPERYDPAYGEWLAEDLVPAIDSLLPSGAGGRHSLFGMLAGGAGQPYQQNWHRDIQFLLEDTVSDADLSEEKCLELMQGKSVQFNAPLFSDSHLHIVPRSHLHGSTPTEIAVTTLVSTFAGYKPSVRPNRHPRQGERAASNRCDATFCS